MIQWYPGHIAKAEKQLKKNLEKIDLIIEVRDARIPRSTSHPHLDKWTQGKKHLLVINRKDMIPKTAVDIWKQWFNKFSNQPLWCDAKRGDGITELQQAAIQAGESINTRRRSRGMKDRPIRALTLGFPNVGKSALINRLMKKKVAISSRKAGVTRTLQWIRLGKDLDLLDAPGVLPPRIDNQDAALKLAFCDDIGPGSYDVELVAIAFLNTIQKLKDLGTSGVKNNLLEKRYGLPLQIESSNAEEWLVQVANQHTSGDSRRMAQRILDDFRKSSLGNISLELP